jgi:hypothetical protein
LTDSLFSHRDLGEKAYVVRFSASSPPDADYDFVAWMPVHDHHEPVLFYIFECS